MRTTATLKCCVRLQPRSVYQKNNIFAFREECSSKGGTNDGSCASGYGVCCVCK